MSVLILGDYDGTVPEDARVGRFFCAGPEADAWLDAELAAAVVGWRCTVIGAEGEVARSRARCLHAGAEPDEITTVVTAAGGLGVYCPLCGTVGPDTPCARCGAELEVTDQISVVHSARLGIPAV